jgi:hypothetical protein
MSNYKLKKKYNQNIATSPLTFNFGYIYRMKRKFIGFCRKSRKNRRHPLFGSYTLRVNYSHIQFKIVYVRTIFSGSDVEKIHAVVMRNIFRSKNPQNIRDSGHF